MCPKTIAIVNCNGILFIFVHYFYLQTQYLFKTIVPWIYSSFWNICWKLYIVYIWPKHCCYNKHCIWQSCLYAYCRIVGIISSSYVFKFFLANHVCNAQNVQPQPHANPSISRRRTSLLLLWRICLCYKGTAGAAHGSERWCNSKEKCLTAVSWRSPNVTVRLF